MTTTAGRKGRIEPALRVRFHNWLTELNDAQIAALADNWDNVMDDAALDRIDSWIIADQTLAELRRKRDED